MADIPFKVPGPGFPINAVLGGVASGVGALFQNAANRRMADRQMAFQERMSSTAYQRAMVDMRKAGLNPMLAFQQGGASTPGGASAQMQDVIGPSTNSARAGLEQRLQLRLLSEQMQNVNADTALKTAQGMTEAERTMMTEAQRLLFGIQAKALKEQIPKYQFEGGVWRRLDELLGTAEEMANRPRESFGEGVRRGMEMFPKWLQVPEFLKPGTSGKTIQPRRRQ